ncbi:hypothetical protein FACHB389_05090 [Nostoc calcicola FACHB-389]|nr:hypothetical protein FACHB389_05090 [Nostoc calcicola FACHB-389]
MRCIDRTIRNSQFAIRNCGQNCKLIILRVKARTEIKDFSGLKSVVGFKPPLKELANCVSKAGRYTIHNCELV